MQIPRLKTYAFLYVINVIITSNLLSWWTCHIGVIFEFISEGDRDEGVLLMSCNREADLNSGLGIS